MERNNSLITTLKRNSFFCFVYMPCVSFIFLAFMLLLCYPDAAASGVKNGMDICLNTLIPTLFPFMFFSNLLINLDLSGWISKRLDRLTGFVFDLPGEALPIIIMSLIGGYPVGSFMIKNAYESGKITRLQGKRMLCFCVNPGPAFTVITIGSALFGSKKTGLIVYLSCVISALIIGVLSRFLYAESESEYVTLDTKQSVQLSSGIMQSVNVSVHSTVNICVWVVIFSCLNSLADILPLNDSLKFFFSVVSEVTNGVFVAANKLPLPAICAIVGFSGFCIHLQVMPAIITLKLKYKYFLAFRVISGAISCVVCFFLMQLFPQYVSTFSLGARPEKISFASSVPMCVCVMIMCGLFAVGDGYVIRKKDKIKNSNAFNKAELY